VVPTTYVICKPAKTKEAPLWPGTRCALGAVSLWLKDIELPEILYDSSRFVKDPVYAHYMSNLNLFTYLIDHGDGNPDNFVVSDNDERRQVFSIDNGVALGHVPNSFVVNWNVIRVPALRKDSIDRLRGLERTDLDFLTVLEELELDDSRVYIPVVSPGENMAPYQGFMEREGTIQFGLTAGEIDAVWSRIQNVIADVDSGKIEVF
jgi:hypothetical protein